MTTDVISALMPEAWDEAQSQIATVLRRFQPSALELVAGAGIRIRPLMAGERYIDVCRELRRLELCIDEWPHPPAGIFVLAERCVYLRTLSDMTIAHEFGHAIDLALGGDKYLSDTDPEIREAFASARRFVTPYAASRIDEYFAESVRAYVGCNDPTSGWPDVNRGRLATCDPRMFEIVERLLCAAMPVS